jgi:virulence factor Mce-like protein
MPGKSSDRLLLEIRRSLRPFLLLIGLATVAGVAFVIIEGKLTFARPWKHYEEVRAQFTDVKGIFPGGHQVRIHGVKVGIVSKADLVDGHKAVLTLKIEPRYGKIYKDARLQIRPVTPLDDLYVNVIDRGHPDAGVATKSWIIPPSQTIAPVDISRVLDTFNADTREHMTILLDELGKGMSDGGERLNASFAGIAPFLRVAQQATAVLHHREANIKRLVHNFGGLSNALAERDLALTQFVRSGNETLGELAAHDRDLGATFTTLAGLLPEMRASLASVEQMSGHLDPALTSLEPVTAKLESGLEGLQRLGDDAVPALTQLRPAVSDLRRAARTLPKTSASLNVAFSNLDAQAPKLDRLTQQVVPCLSTLNRFMNNTLSVFKFFDANGAFPRADETVDTDAFAEGPQPSINSTRLPSCTD